MGHIADGVDPRFVEFRRTRDRRLRNLLIEDHRWVAEQVARRFPNRTLPHDDVLQVAYLGLLKAVERFDPEREVKFTTFAEPTISGELKRHFRDHAWDVRVSRRAHDLYQAVQRTAEDLIGELGRAPTMREIADRLRVDPDDVAMATEADRVRRAQSLSAPVGDDDGGTTVGDQLGAEDPDLERVAEQVTVRGLLSSLPAREREILRLRFEEHLSQSEIGQRVGISQMHVSRLLRRTLAELRAEVHPELGDPDG